MRSAERLTSETIETAFLNYGLQTFYFKHRAAPQVPQSAVTGLIQGIYDRDPAMARKILRSRIYTQSRRNEMDAGMVKVAAKRIDFESPVTELLESFGNVRHLIEILGGSRLIHQGLRIATEIQVRDDLDAIEICRTLLKAPSTGLPLYKCDRPVAALLVSDEGALLESSINQNASNRTLHAEVGLLQSYFARKGEGIPAGSRIYSTLKPCKMCAGMIVHCARDLETIEVIYVEDDPGRNARFTALDGLKIQRQVRQDCV